MLCDSYQLFPALKAIRSAAHTHIHTRSCRGRKRGEGERKRERESATHNEGTPSAGSRVTLQLSAATNYYVIQTRNPHLYSGDFKLRRIAGFSLNNVTVLFILRRQFFAFWGGPKLDRRAWSISWYQLRRCPPCNILGKRRKK